MCFGLAYALAFFWGWMTPLISFGLFLGSIVAAMFLRKRRSTVDKIVLLLERENHLFNIPLRGLIFFLLGVTVTIYFFDLLPALGGIVVLSVADSIGTLYGKYMGRLHIPWNKDKHLEGPIIGGGLAALACVSFLPVLPALVGAYVGAFIDTLTIRIFGFELDDNLIIPIISATCITFLL